MYVQYIYSNDWRYTRITASKTLVEIKHSNTKNKQKRKGMIIINPRRLINDIKEFNLKSKGKMKKIKNEE